MAEPRPASWPAGNWRSVRLWEGGMRSRLRQRHGLWLHGWCIGTLVLLVMWGAAHLQMVLGSDSLALRYLVTLGVGYLAYLVVLRLWAGALVRRREGGDGGLGDVAVPDLGGGPPRAGAPAPEVFRAGGGGDFGGGGASADFADGAEPGAALAKATSGALDAAGSADEAAVVVIPVAVVFLAGCLLLFGAGSLLLLYFSSEVLLAVAVELAFGYVTARTAVRVAREGWLGAVVRLTWKPLLGALVCAVAVGAVVDVLVPQARSLPEAVRLLR